VVAPIEAEVVTVELSFFGVVVAGVACREEPQAVATRQQVESTTQWTRRWRVDRHR
jgi:hypothetical protein